MRAIAIAIITSNPPPDSVGLEFLNLAILLLFILVAHRCHLRDCQPPDAK